MYIAAFINKVLKQQSQKQIWQVAATYISILLAPNVQGSCYVSNNITPQNITLNVKRILIQPSLSVGDRIARIQSQIQGVTGYGYCDTPGGLFYARFTRPMTPVSGMDKVFQTDVPGVGIRLYRDAGQGPGAGYYPYDLPINVSANKPRTNMDLGAGGFIVELIKTAAITGSGPIASNGPFTTYYADGSGLSLPILKSTLTGYGITIVTSTCEVDAGSKNIAVNFGTVSSTTFNGIGSKGPDHDFAINLLCNGGNVPEEDQGTISVRIDATQDSSKRPGVLAITETKDAASRIGIELVDVLDGSEHQIKFGKGIALGKTTVNGNNTFTLPMRARYIETQTGKVGPGTANGTATFTIEYK
ncbi:MAG TPA: fimbrial protein [Xylella sp.]